MKAGSGARIEKLRRDRGLRAFAQIAAGSGARAWIVGGAVRDLLLGREVLEVDLAVSGSVERLARQMEREGWGRAVDLSRLRPGPRVFRVAGPRTIDLAELEGASVEEDLARRDFTVNAIAVDLSSGQVIDPFGGREDLRRRLLRPVAEKNFLEDPLRALRAVRLMATHGLKPDKRTAVACRLAARKLAGVSPERIHAEIAAILESLSAAPCLRWAASAGLLERAFGLGTKRKWRAIARKLGSWDEPQIRNLPPKSRRRARLAGIAALFSLSPREASRWLRLRRYGREEARQVVSLLSLRQRALKAATEEELWRWVRDSGSLREDALLLLSRLGPEGKRAARRLSARAAKARKKPEVRGADILQWSGLSQGPVVGILLAELEIEILRGRIRNRGEARRWLQKRLRTGAEAARPAARL